jgi:transposase
MKRIFDRVCGLDVHRDTVHACVRVTGAAGNTTQQPLSVGTKYCELLALSGWLKQWQVTHVAMEATGEYWKPVCCVLETDFTVLLVNPAHVKNVPGRKTDTQDAEWLAQLLECGLLQASFVPPPEIRDLRDLTRYRKKLIEERTAEVLRVHGVLQRAGIELSPVASNVTGVSGRAMIERLIAGERDPAVLADLAKGSLRGKLGPLQQALAGNFRGHHGFVLDKMLEYVDFLDEKIAQLNQEVDRQMAPFQVQEQHLKTIPGIKDRTVEVIIAEIGANMGQFPTVGNLCSWAGVCPGNNQSATKRKPERTGKRGRWLKPALNEAAWAAVRKSGNYLAAQYHHLVKGLGKKKAITAVMHSMLAIAYHLLRDGQDYHDLGSGFFLKRNQQAIEARCVRQLKRLGYAVTLTPGSVAA